MQPNTLIAYAFPAWLGFPPLYPSIRLGVKYPSKPQIGTMLANTIKALAPCTGPAHSILTILQSTAAKGSRAAAARNAMRLALAQTASVLKWWRYHHEPTEVAPRYVKTTSANEYTCVFRTGVKSRVHTTSIAIALNPVQNKTQAMYFCDLA